MIIVMGGEKGGTGKTTLATNLAAVRATADRDMLLVDTDPQGSASNWATVRDESQTALPRIACIQKFGRGIARELRDLAGRYQDIIVDTGGRDSVELRGALVVADVIAIPVQASQLDLWTMDQIDKVIQEARALNPALRASVVISRAPTHPHMTDVADAKDLLNDFTSLQLVSVVVRERVAYRRAAGAGCSVHEFLPRDEAACTEITALCTELYGLLLK